MSRLGPIGLTQLLTDIKNWVLSKIPTKTSQLTNDSNFLTSHQSLSNYSTLANTVKSISISGKTITVTPGSGSAYTLTTQDTNTDTLMTQNVSTTNNKYPILLCPTAEATANQGAKTGIFGANALINPSTGEIISKSNGTGAFRVVGGNYGFFIRNDGSNTYFLLTASGDQYGSWTSARPLTINDSTGACNISGNAATATQFSANKDVTLTGYINGTASSKAGWSIATALKNCYFRTTGTVTNTYFKVASGTLTGGWNRYETLIRFVETTGNASCTLRIYMQLDGSALFDAGHVTVLDSVNFGTGAFNVVYKNDTDKTLFEIYYQLTPKNHQVNALVLYETERKLVNSCNVLTMYNDSTPVAALPSDYTLLTTEFELYCGDLVPAGNNKNLGSSDAKWSNVYATTFTGNLTGNVTGNVSGTAANVTGTVAIANGGTGATTRQNAVKNLFNSAIANANVTHFNVGTSNWGDSGYVSVANAKVVLGINMAMENNTGRDCNAVTGNGIQYYNSNGPATSLGASTNDGSLYTQYHNNKWINQIAQDYRNGNLFTRGMNNGTWQAWKAVAYHGDNVSKFTNDAGYLTAHQSLSNYVTLNGTQTISGVKTISAKNVKYTASVTRGTAPSAAVYKQPADYVDSAGNRIFLFETVYNTDKSSKTGLYAYNTTAATGNSIGNISIGCDASGNVYTQAPTPATADNSTKIATTAFVKAQGYLTSHQSLSNYSTLANTVKSISISGKTITVTPGSGSAYTLTTQDTVYTHPTTSGNKHIPSGGSSGQFLGWASDGTAKWVNNPNTNTDTLMTQNVSTTDATYPILLTATADATANLGAKAGIFGSGVKVNPSTSIISCKGISGSPTAYNSFVNAVKDGGSLVSSLASYFGGVWSAPTKNYRVAAATFPNSGDNVYICYSVTNANVEAGTNQVAKQLTWNADSGTLTANSFSGALTGDVTGNVTGNCSGSSGSCTGNAATATKLATARNIALGNEFIGSANFDGSGNITINGSAYLSVISIGNKNNYPYHCFAKFGPITSQYTDAAIKLLVSRQYIDGGSGIIELEFRTNATNGDGQCAVRWIARSSKIPVDCIQVGFYKTWGGIYADVFYKSSYAYDSCVIRSMGDGSRASYERKFTLQDSNEANNTTASDPRTSVNSYASIAAAGTALHNQAYTDAITATDGGVVGTANACSGNSATASKVVATVANDNTGALVQGTMGSNDCFRIAIGGANNAGWAEIATGDDYNEPIYVRQYQGSFATLKRTATLLDASGNTAFPGTVTATGFTGNVTGNCSGSSGSCTGNAATATQFSANATVALTGDATGTSAGSKKGWSVPVTLANSGVTAGTYGPSADVTGNNNATISVPQITVDAKGRVTSVTNRTLTCKNNTYNVYNKTLTIQKNGTNVATFTSNSNTDVTANITVPTKTSELTNDSGFLTSHQSLSNYVTLNGAQTISGVKTISTNLKFSTTNTRGKAPSANEERDLIDYRDSAGNRISLFETMYNTDKSSKTAIYAYKTTTATGGNIGSMGIGCDSSGNVYTFAPTPATSDNSTKIATTAFVKAQGYLTSHQSLSNYSTLANTVKSLSISGKTITVTPGSGSAYTLTTQDTVYTHPTTAGNKHVPSGGSSGQFLGWDSAGTAKWVNNPNTDTKVRQDVGTSSTERPILSRYNTEDASQTANYVVYDTGVTNNPKTHTLTASGGFKGNLTGNVTGNCSGTAANVTGTVAIANGGTGATSRLNAVKALTNENVGTAATYFLGITNSWGKAGYISVADARTVLEIPTFSIEKFVWDHTINLSEMASSSAWEQITGGYKYTANVSLKAGQLTWIYVYLITSNDLIKVVITNGYILSGKNCVDGGKNSIKADTTTYGSVLTQTVCGSSRLNCLFYPYNSTVTLTMTYTLQNHAGGENPTLSGKVLIKQ